MLTNLVVPAAGLTALLGLLVASQAYRGYRRHDSQSMRALAVGIAFLTVVPFLLQYVLAPVAKFSDAATLLGVVAAYVVGLVALLQSFQS